MWRVKHLDDRRRPVRLVRFGPARVLSPAALWGTLRGAAAHRATYLSIFVVAMLGSLVALAVKVGPLVLAVAMFSPVSSTLIVLVSITLVALLAAWSDRGDRLANDMVRAGRCAGCAYSLEGLGPEPDGCTVCPECGAAWNRAERLAPPRTVVIPNQTTSHQSAAHQSAAPKHDPKPYKVQEPIPSPPHARHPS